MLIKIYLPCVVSLAQIFDVRLNGELNVVTDLDIFSQVGYAVAHDVYVPFTVEEDELEAFGAKTDFTGVLNVEFVKVSGSCMRSYHVVEVCPSSQKCRV